MTHDTLEDRIARSQAREAIEACKAGQDPPAYHLGGPPEPWEIAIGDAGERLSRQGRNAIEYAAKMNAMGINEKSLAGENNPIADHIRTIGQDKIRLLPGVPAAPTRMAAALEGSAIDEEDDAGSASSNWSGSSVEDVPAGSRAHKGVTAADEGPPDPGEPDDESPDGIDLIDDSEIRNAIEDFDSRNWTLDQLEVSCQTLLEECYASEDRRRRLLSAGMLRKLVEIYPSALRWMQRSLEAVVNDGLPGMVKGTLDARVFKLDVVLGILAPAMAETMTQLNVGARVLRLMLYKMDTAARVIVFRYTLPKWLAQYRHLPGGIATHKRMTLLMQGVELRARWRRVNADQTQGSFPPSVLHAYLCIILALVDEETCPTLYRTNRIKVVGACGLLALSVHFKAGDRSQRLACRILRELAREPLLIFELLNAGVAECLSRLLPKLRETCIDRLLEALDAVDSMAFSAMRFCELSTAHPSRGQGNAGLVAALVADGSSIGGWETEIRIPSSDKAEETIREQLGLPNLVALLAGMLREADVQLFLAGVVILGKLATTVCYHSVLQEMLAYAGRALELLVQGVQSQEQIVPDMSMALFLQLCSRQEGRDGIEATDGVEMLRPLISGCQAQDSPVFLRGLACAVAIARQGGPGSAPGTSGDGATPSVTAPPGLSLPRAGGVGRSGPARPHPLDFDGKIYNDLVEMLDAPQPAPSKAVQGLVRMGTLEAVMRFLVRDDDEEGFGEDDVEDVRGAVSTRGRVGGGVTGMGGKKISSSFGGAPSGPHFFRLKQRHACLGAVALHGLAVLAGPHPAIMTDATLRYLCYSIQVAYMDLTVGKLAPGVGYPLVFRSIQLACRALAFLATSDGVGAGTGGYVAGAGGESRSTEVGNSAACKDSSQGGAVDHGPLRRVADSLISTTAINEVASIAQMPSRAAWAGEEGCIYRHLERTVSSAAILVAGVCPIPAGERDPFTRFDEPEDEELSLQLCQPLMARLVTTLGGPLCSTLMVAENLEIIAHACRALAKLSDTNTTVQMLLDSHDVMKAIIRLGPRAPAVLPAAFPTPTGAAYPPKDGSLSPDRPLHDRVEGTQPARENHNAKATASRREQPQATAAPATPPRQSKVAMLGIDRRGRGGGESPWSAQWPSCSYQNREPGGLGGGATGGGLSCVHVPSSGYGVREGEIADASTRKLCSLPFDYFRLVANAARVPSGRAVVQSSGTLKRCLERMALDVSGCAAARLATLRCRTEICVLVGRMAGTYDRKTGAANDFILHRRYQTLSVLVGMLAAPPDHGMVFGASRMQMELARHNAAYALAEICRDTLRSVPLVADAGGVDLACRVVNDLTSPMPLLKQVIRVLQGAASFPDGEYASPIADPAVLRSLNRIANNAYPGFRPATSGGRGCPSSSAPETRRRPQTSSTLEHGGHGGRTDVQVGAGAAQGRDALALVFNLAKPFSRESRLISELATEVAYLVGARADKIRSPRKSFFPSGPQGSDKQTKEPQWVRRDEHGPLTSEAAAAAVRAGDADQAEWDFVGSVSSKGTTTGKEARDFAAGVEDMQTSMTTPVPAPGGRGVRAGDGIISGRPGAYLGCGVTSCKGLGFIGEHGDAVGTVPHAAFALRAAKSASGGNESEACDNGTQRLSVTSLDSNGSGEKVERLLDEHDEGSPAEASADVVLATPLALLSAREPRFRNELIRRKEHYGLGRMNNDSVGSEEKGGAAPRNSAVPIGPHHGKTCKAPSAIVDRGHLAEATRRLRPRRTPGGCLPAPVDVGDSHLLASTRPTSAQRALEGRTRDPTCAKEGDGLHKGVPPTCQEYVTFARPAAHWSVTKSLSDSSGRVRSKGVRVPKDRGNHGRALVVGRFACRGYLLDPTFQDDNPVILHPRLPLIEGIGGGFSQVPDDSTLGDLVARAQVSGGPKGGAGKNVEPYRNVVEVLRHSVGVSGAKNKAEC